MTAPLSGTSYQGHYTRDLLGPARRRGLSGLAGDRRGFSVTVGRTRDFSGLAGRRRGLSGLAVRG